jgi:hypothetical protein
MKEKLLTSLGVAGMIGFTHIDPVSLLNLLSGLSILEVLVLMITGSIMIGKIRLNGWQEKMPIYLVKCSKHGFQITYPMGHMANLVCPKCALA